MANPLQYSCLGNPMDRGAWRATVHRVRKRQTHTHTYTGRRKAKTNRRKKSQKTPENSEEHGLCRSQGRREFSEGKANTVQTVKRSRKLERTKCIGYDPWEVTGDFQKVQKSHFSN